MGKNRTTMYIYNSYEMTTACTLVKNLPDVITESDENVGLPPMLEQKWRKEGRYEKKCLN